MLSSKMGAKKDSGVKLHFPTKYSWITCLCIVVTLTGCSLNGHPTPPPSAQNPPLYPGAQNVQIREQTYLKIITFATSDKPEAVLSYYKSSLVAEGWTFYSDLSNNQREAFSWGLQPGKYETVYELTIALTPMEQGSRSNVEIKLVTEVPK